MTQVLDTITPPLVIGAHLQPSEVRGMSPRLIWNLVDFMTTREPADGA